MIQVGRAWSTDENGGCFVVASQIKGALTACFKAVCILLMLWIKTEPTSAFNNTVIIKESYLGAL